MKDFALLATRRHPQYKKKLKHWNFLEETYNGGEEWYDENIFKYLKEGDTEYKDRVERAYRFNHTKEVVDLVTKYIFKSVIHRNKEAASEKIKKFWKGATRSNSSIDKFMREVSTKASIFGRIWIVVDNNNDGSMKTLADEKNEDFAEYAYIVKPQNVLDLSYDDRGNLLWILISEIYRDDDDPFSASGAMTERYRLWTKDDWFLFGKVDEAKSMSHPVNVATAIEKGNVELLASGNHGLGVVPVFSHDHTDNEELYTSPALICDIAYLDRAVANYLSNLDAIIQDQTFSQLAMPAHNVMPNEDAYQKLTEVGTKRIFLFDGEHGGQPFFLSPDPRQAELIITAIKTIINEIYHSVGMAGERTKQDNAVGIDNSSGVAKAYDFERVNSLLTSKGSALQKAEIKMLELVSLWNGESYDIEELEKLVVYPETYDVRGLANEFEISNNLVLIQAPMSMRKEQMRVLVEKLFPVSAEKAKQEMLAEIEEMIDPVDKAMDNALKMQESKNDLAARSNSGKSKMNQDISTQTKK